MRIDSGERSCVRQWSKRYQLIKLIMKLCNQTSRAEQAMGWEFKCPKKFVFWSWTTLEIGDEVEASNFYGFLPLTQGPEKTQQLLGFISLLPSSYSTEWVCFHGSNENVIEKKSTHFSALFPLLLRVRPTEKNFKQKKHRKTQSEKKNITQNLDVRGRENCLDSSEFNLQLEFAF